MIHSPVIALLGYLKSSKVSTPQKHVHITAAKIWYQCRSPTMEE